MTTDFLKSLIVGHRYTWTDEKQLQDGIEALLTSAGVPFEREFRLSMFDRPDFMVGRVVIEVKVKGSRWDVVRQLHRYAQSPIVDAIILVTTKANHLSMPLAIHGKPVVVADLITGGAF